MSPIFGIPCRIQNPRIRRAIRTVLSAVKQRPRDWARLRGRVTEFRYPGRPEDESTLGEWNPDPGDVDRLRRLVESDPTRWGDPDPHFTAKGWISLSRRAARLPWPILIAVVVHECGHAVTRERDFTARDGVSSWASELCADMYAFKWGFEEQIRIHEPSRSFGHHAVLPGKKIGMDAHDGTTIWWKVDRRFHLRPVHEKKEAKKS